MTREELELEVIGLKRLLRAEIEDRIVWQNLVNSTAADNRKLLSELDEKRANVNILRDQCDRLEDENRSLRELLEAKP